MNNMLRFPHICVISASAGAGKTYTLSQRYIDFLLSYNILPRNILAITFTNKAAIEMKLRIIYGLKRIALSDDAIQNIYAAQKLEQLLNNYSDFRVQTIDSFLTYIIRASALELDLPPNFDIAVDSSSIIEFILDEFLSQIHLEPHNNKINTIFLKFLNELLRIKPELGWDIKREILDNISRLMQQEKITACKIESIFKYDDIERHRERLVEDVKKLYNENKLKLKKHFVNAAEKLIQDKQYQPWKSKMFCKESIYDICKKDTDIDISYNEIWQSIRKQIACLAEMAAHCRFTPFIELLSLFDEHMNKFKKRQQIIFIEDLSLKLNTLIYRDNIIPEIYFRFGDRILHFFIDEFQDTSQLQWENLCPLIEEGLSRGGSLFYVGDKKQAIYGFRGGDKRLFDNAKKCFNSIVQDNIYTEFSEINYRSGEYIVRFVNDIFSAKNLTSWVNAYDINVDISLLLNTYYKSAQMVSKDNTGNGYVRIEKISTEDVSGIRELEQVIVDKVTELLNSNILLRTSPRNIAILVRTNTEVALFTRALTLANIPIASEKTLDISENALVNEIISFLVFLDAPMDNLAFASFISGSIFTKATGITQDEIFSFLLNTSTQQKPLYILFRNKYNEIWDKYIKEYIHAVGFLPPYDLVSRIIKRYNIFCNFQEKEGIFYQLLEVLRYSETKCGNSLKAFLSLWKTPDSETKELFYVNLPEYIDAVKIYTIHKAKGLGFPIVIVPFPYLNNASVNEVYDKDDMRLIPYRINQEILNVSPKLQQFKQQNITSQIIDELNIFYVALTRAKNELYIFLPEFDNMKVKNRLPVPVSIDDTDIVEYGVLKDVDNIQKSKQHLLRRVHPDVINEWQTKLYRKCIPIEELADLEKKKAKEKGRLIHRFLSMIERLSMDNWEKEIEDKFELLKDNEKDIIPVIRNFFANDRIRTWFVVPEDVCVYCEKEVVDDTGTEYRIDRMLVSSDKVQLIEFKYKEFFLEYYESQVTNYLKIISNIYLDKLIEGYLVYVDTASYEQVSR